MEDIKLYESYYNKFSERYNEENTVDDKIKDNITVSIGTSVTNVVSGERLRKVQESTLKEVAMFISKTFGPMGSNTKIITGNNREAISSSYSKDGLKVLKHISNVGPIESSIIEELVDISQRVEKEVGDGTTSTVILSSLIFSKLIKIQEHYKIPPFELMRIFDRVVSKIKEKILSNSSECEIEDIYDICMISTNGNKEVSENIKNIYNEFGMDVDLSVGISNDSNSKIKSYDGLTITEGMSDPVYINIRENNTSEIHNANIYHFSDPIDTMDMIQYLESIIFHNIYDPLTNNETPIPTVITCPRMSKDASNVLKQLIEFLYQYDQTSKELAKPPILIIDNVVASDEIIMDDIANLCGCRTIKKYIDPRVKEKDIADGKCPTPENVHEFCGFAELVVADAKKTKFINPGKDYEEREAKYKVMVNFLESEIEAAKERNDSSNDIGLLKKRLSALKSNLVEYLVGGVTIAERDATKDLVEDAIKNCKSASKYGFGYAANFEGLLASLKYLHQLELDQKDDIEIDIARCIFNSYCDIASILYGTVSGDKKEVWSRIFYSIRREKPYDISSGRLPEIADNSTKVKCSIMLDINILDTISKIITIMVTCNQCLLQAPSLNNY